MKTESTMGRVYLVGAGPGDPELLTLKAVRVLGLADVVLIDDLVDRAVLCHVRPAARVIHVGKRGGCRSTAQSFIERLMQRFARRGAVVVRLKGGDPFVFGRGGEELLALEAAGIPVETVSGITAGIAAPAAIGIPITHRGMSHGVTLVTGHTRDDLQPDWKALARTGTTLVIYMGMGNLASIVAGLRSGGMDGSTPAAIVQSGTTPRQESAVGNLDNIEAVASTAKLGSPAIIVVGAVAAFGARAATGATSLAASLAA